MPVAGQDEDRDPRATHRGMDPREVDMKVDRSGHRADAGPDIALLRKKMIVGRSGSVCLNNFRAFLSGFPPRLRCRHFGRLRVEAGLIGGFPVKG
jgi:hypothetical protein